MKNIGTRVVFSRTSTTGLSRASSTPLPAVKPSVATPVTSEPKLTPRQKSALVGEGTFKGRVRQMNLLKETGESSFGRSGVSRSKSGSSSKSPRAQADECVRLSKKQVEIVAKEPRRTKAEDSIGLRKEGPEISAQEPKLRAKTPVIQQKLDPKPTTTSSEYGHPHYMTRTPVNPSEGPAQKMVYETAERSGVHLNSLVDKVVFDQHARAPYFTVDPKTGERTLALDRKTVEQKDSEKQKRDILHELGHAEEWKRRLMETQGDHEKAFKDWDTKFGSKEYAKEEVKVEGRALYTASGQSQPKALDREVYQESREYIDGWHKATK